MKRFCLLLFLGSSPPLPSRTKACGRSTISRRRPSKQKYGVDIDDAWLGRLQRSITRLEGGCTGSFVSPDGLVLTNHHCATACIGDLSSAERQPHRERLQLAARAPASASVRAEIISVLVEHRRRHREGERLRRPGLPTPRRTKSRKQTLSRSNPTCTAAAQGPRRRARLRIGDAVSGRPILPLQVQSLRRRAPGVRAGAVDRSVRRRSGQFQFPALVPRFSLMRVYENGKPARTPDLSAVARRRAARRRAGVPRRPSRQHRRLLTDGAAEVPARRRPSRRTSPATPSCAAG